MGADELEEMFLWAIQGEINDREAHLSLADPVEEIFLKRKLTFLADEEKKHRTTLEEMFKAYCPEKEIVLPGKGPGPEPDMDVEDTSGLIQILEVAMELEMNAQNNYLSLAEQLSDSIETSVTLRHFVALEASHYGLLKIEKEHLERLRDVL